MDLNGDEPAKKLKYLPLKSVGKSVKSPKVLESEEVAHVEVSEEDSDDEEMDFIIKRFHYMAKKNKIFSGKKKYL